MGVDEAGDWFTDPFGRHEARWMSHGTPTSLVRDGRTEGFDPVPNDPYAVKPVRIKYVDHEPGAQSGGFLKSKGGIAVPGGIVTTELHRTKHDHVPVGRVLLEATVMNVQQDIVVWDEEHEHKLYVDGPYDSIMVARPLERIVKELKRIGVDEFVSSRGGGVSRIVTVTRPTPGQMTRKTTLTWIGSYRERVVQFWKRL